MKNEMKNCAEIIGHRIKVLRVSKNLTQKQLGKILGYSDQQISKIESGKGLVTFEFIVKTCRYFNIKIDFFDPDEPMAEIAKSK